MSYDGTAVGATVDVGIDVYEKSGNVGEERDMLVRLLDQDLFLEEKRSQWYLRLIRSYRLMRAIDKVKYRIISPRSLFNSLNDSLN